MSSYSGNIVSICPKYRLPEILLEEISMDTSHMFCCDTFDRLHHILWGNSLNCLNEKMNMIQIYPNFMKDDFKRLFFYFMETYLFERFIKSLMLKYLSSVLYRANKMVQEKVYIMCFDDVGSFHTKIVIC
jgi:hypothetical protein